MLVGLVAAGCSSGTDETTALSETTVSMPTTVTTAATTTTTEAIAADASCVECHTDQATLQALAVEPVAGEILSEGEG
jgi:cytochrome c551/c552